MELSGYGTVQDKVHPRCCILVKQALQHVTLYAVTPAKHVNGFASDGPHDFWP